MTQRRRGLFRALLLLAAVGAPVPAAFAQVAPAPAPAATHTPVPAPAQLRDGAHDFDFEIGTWKTHLERLLHPLSGSDEWAEYDGITTVRKVWDGRANLVELVADGPAGHFEGLNMRLYNPQSRQWSLNFASSRSGTLATPTIGGFVDGVGTFHDQEDFNGRAVFVRFLIIPVDVDTIRFEQSFSADGGKTWELNWVATDTRIE
jgi:hypothetical protein